MNDIKLKYPDYLNIISDLFAEKGYTLYIVGGFIRDSLINRTSSDIDICSLANPGDVIALLSDSKGFTITQLNLPLGTILIKHKNQVLEYTSFRRESYRLDGSHTPTEVSLNASIQEDALRRDFTCNAIYYDIKNDKIIDFFKSITDIGNNTIKTTRAPKDVFQEDALRILRMARISAETLLVPNGEVVHAAKILSPTLLKLSKERIVQELNKLFLSGSKYPNSSFKNFAQGIKVLFECGGANVLFPGAYYERSRLATGAKSLPCKIALFIDGCTQLTKSLDYICPNNSVKKDVLFLLKKNKFIGSNSLELISQYGYEKSKLLEEYLSIKNIDHSELSRYLSGMSQKGYIISKETLKVDGNDIKKSLGLKASPIVGDIKNELLKHVIKNPKSNTKDKLIDYLKKHYSKR